MGKRIAIATIGTQGDIQPYVALSICLLARGHSVVLGAPDDFEEFVTGHGIEFCSLGSDIHAFLKDTQFENAMSQNILVNAPSLLLRGQEIVDTAARQAWSMAQGADIILLNMNTSFGIDIADALQVPAIMAAPQPLNTTEEFPLCAYRGPSFGKTFNRLSYAAMDVQQAYYNLPRNKFRREHLGLKSARLGGFFKDNFGKDLTVLYAFSRHVVPRPKDWPPSAKITGYWTLADNSGWQASAGFERFLAAGEPPIYVGFGSMPFGARRNTEILHAAVERWGGRVVVARGWGGIDPDQASSNIFVIDNAPHDKLFDRVAGVVHHGGAGTTAAGLQAGQPTFVVPQTVDQPYWGSRVYDLGCGPEPVQLRKLTPDNLTDAFAALSSSKKYRRNAQKIAERLNAEDGAANAADLIEGCLGAAGNDDQETGVNRSGDELRAR
ncbi:MAG: glycosyltransferase family 1 protein [Alphaproteobacteria bacterium]|nr:glycosyltransferase family 1 protein [Alphaproteobacteria bacterium]